MSDNIKHTTDAEFQADVLDSDIPVLVDLWAEWCAPCKAIAPMLAEVAEELAGKMKIVKLDVDNNPVKPGELGVRGIPTLVVFKGGQEVERLVGAVPKQKLMQMLGPHLS